jgi:hypothetical protein
MISEEKIIKKSERRSLWHLLRPDDPEKISRLRQKRPDFIADESSFFFQLQNIPITMLTSSVPLSVQEEQWVFLYCQWIQKEPMKEPLWVSPITSSSESQYEVISGRLWYYALLRSNEKNVQCYLMPHKNFKINHDMEHPTDYQKNTQDIHEDMKLLQEHISHHFGLCAEFTVDSTGSQGCIKLKYNSLNELEHFLSFISLD